MDLIQLNKNEIKTANEAWLELVHRCANSKVVYGNKPSASGQVHNPSYEAIGSSIVVNMQYPVVSMVARKLSYRFMFAEAYWILSGSNKVADIAPYNKHISKFSDDGEIFQGAYGPSVVEQIPYVVETLRSNSMSRQAVMTTWNRNPEASKDIPCTISTQFLIRNRQLHLVHTMRSSDIWLGWPYDIFNFTMIALWVIKSLQGDFGQDLEIGNLYFTAGSQHLYLKDTKDCLGRLSGNTRAQFYRPITAKSFNHCPDILAWLTMMRDKNYGPWSTLSEIMT